MIYLRFGTIANEDQVVRSVEQVFRLTGVKPKTIYDIIQRWRRNFFTVLRCTKAMGRPKKLSMD